MALVVQDPNSPPPERFQFPVAATGFTVEAGNYNQLFVNIAAHCTANEVPIPDQQTVVDWLCHNLRLRCYDDHTRIPLINLVGTAFTPTRACCGQSKK